MTRCRPCVDPASVDMPGSLSLDTIEHDEFGAGRTASVSTLPGHRGAGHYAVRALPRSVRRAWSCARVNTSGIPIPAFGDVFGALAFRQVERMACWVWPLRLDEDLVDRHHWRLGELFSELGHGRLELGTLPRFLVRAGVAPLGDHCYLALGAVGGEPGSKPVVVACDEIARCRVEQWSDSVRSCGRSPALCRPRWMATGHRRGARPLDGGGLIRTGLTTMSADTSTDPCSRCSSACSCCGRFTATTNPSGTSTRTADARPSGHVASQSTELAAPLPPLLLSPAPTRA